MTNEELVYKYQGGDNETLDCLIEQNKGIINKLVNRYHIEKAPSIDREDLVQEGVLGLITAARKFEPNKAQFITYCCFWIKQRISRYISKSRDNETSLQSPINEENDTLEDIIRDKIDYENLVTESVFLMELRKDLKKSMEKVNTLKERIVLDLNFGLNFTEPMELKEIADILHTNYNNIAETKYNALRKLKHSQVAAKYKNDYLKERQAKKYNSVNELVRCI